MIGRSESVAGVALLAGLVLCAYGATNAIGSTTASKPPGAPNLLLNGKFVLPASEFANELAAFLSPQGYAVNKLPVKRIPGWSVGEGATNGVPNPNAGGVVVYDEQRVQMPNGAMQALQLSDNGPGNISATIKTAPGASYLLTWYGAGYPDGKAGKVIDVSWNGSQIAAPSFKDGTGPNMGWTLHQEVLKATASTSTLAFADGTSPTDPYGPFVGAVSITAENSKG
jgi:Protein of unknown function (DUF642)